MCNAILYKYINEMQPYQPTDNTITKCIDCSHFRNGDDVFIYFPEGFYQENRVVVLIDITTPLAAPFLPDVKIERLQDIIATY